MDFDRRTILKGIAALPGLGLWSGEVTQTHSAPAFKYPRHLLQVGFTNSQFHEFTKKSAWDMDTFLKKKGLIPADAFLEKVFQCATQDVIVFRWQHKDFHPVHNFDLISTCGPSDEWLKVIFGKE